MEHPFFTLNCGGRLVSLARPVVMGILNVTPDSFYDGGKYTKEDKVWEQCERMLKEGATFIDVGGMSSRPGAGIIAEDEEKQRVLPIIEGIHQRFPEALISIDTIRSSVAREASEAGAVLINDISAGKFDKKMYSTAAGLGLPYVLMHMQGEPANMQTRPSYENVSLEILDFFIQELKKLRESGVKDVILDPGFGFGKTVAHNYQLLRELPVFQTLACPVLAGISRKSMICKVLEVKPSSALNGTTALHMLALQNGSRILRVHDVREAVQCIRLWKTYQDAVIE